MLHISPDIWPFLPTGCPAAIFGIRLEPDQKKPDYLASSNTVTPL